MGNIYCSEKAVNFTEQFEHKHQAVSTRLLWRMENDVNRTRVTTKSDYKSWRTLIIIQEDISSYKGVPFNCDQSNLCHRSFTTTLSLVAFPK